MAAGVSVGQDVGPPGPGKCRGWPGLGCVTQLLVVEDDDRIGRLLETGCRPRVRRTTAAHRSWHLEEAAGGSTFDLVILDLGLPDMDGVEVCRELRLIQPATIIVMLTARRDEMDVVAGLGERSRRLPDEAVRPGRAPGAAARASASSSPGRVPRARRPARPRRPRCCTSAPASALSAASRSPCAARSTTCWRGWPRRPASRSAGESLMADVWDENWWGSTKTLDVHIAALRRKLAEAATGAGSGRAQDHDATATATASRTVAPGTKPCHSRLRSRSSRRRAGWNSARP